MPKVSIIVPVYNAEKYVSECLDSIINQTLQDIEIICVDDCGNDNSMQIVEEYAKKDARIKIVYHKKNKGLASARNSGMDIAKGEYIFFLDSDDYMSSDCIETLYNKIIETKSDIVMIGTEAFADDDSKHTLERTENLNCWLENREVENLQVSTNNFQYVIDNYNCTAWGKLFSASFIKNNNLRFFDRNAIFEFVGCGKSMIYRNNILYPICYNYFMNYRRLYIPNRIVFITIVTSKRREILTDNIELLKYAIDNAHKYYNFSIIAICVLKDHVHFLLQPQNINDYSKIITLIKRTFSREIDINKIADYKLSPSNLKRGERDIWQKRFWEHTIRDEDDLYKHLDYIHYNPTKHYNIAPKDWIYSSFQKYVEKGLYKVDWCNFGDKYKIENLNFE